MELAKTPNKIDFKNTDVLKRALIGFLPAYLILIGIFIYIYKIQIQSDLVLKKDHEIHTVLNGKNNVSSELPPIVEDIEFISHLFEGNREASNSIDDEVKLTARFKFLTSELDMFMQTHKKYDQVRFIDDRGWEKIRINNTDTGTQIVNLRDLQFKGNRYYFKESMAIKNVKIYFSPFDLNIEKGKIEIPLKPMIRIAKPIYSIDGDSAGIVILNYLGKYLIKKVETTPTQDKVTLMLINKDGFWLKGMTPEDEWGFMDKNKKHLKFQHKFPDAWPEITRSQTGQIETKNGLFSFTTIAPLDNVIESLDPKSSHLIDPDNRSEYYWKLVSFMPREVLYSLQRIWQYFFIGLSVITFFIVGWIALRLSWLSRVKQENERLLLNANFELEKRVIERTQSLENANTKLRGEVETRIQVQSNLTTSEQKFRTLIESMPEGLIVLDRNGVVTYANEQLAKIIERPVDDIIGKDYTVFFDKINLEIFENEREKRLSGITRPYEISWITGKNKKIYTIVSPAIVRDDAGKFNGSFGIITDITQKKNDEKTIIIGQKRLRTLFELSKMEEKTEHELANFALEKAVQLTESQGGYFHFFDEDNGKILLTSWSEDVLKICESAKGTHYPLESAGIWADCIRQGKPVIHNDYQSISEKKGYPDGHFPVRRHLSIPVYDGDKIIAIAGVGNKASPYDNSDIEQLILLMTETWRIIIKKRVQKDLFTSEAKHRSMMEAMDDPAYICSPDYTISYMNPAMIRWIGNNFIGQACYSSIYNNESVCTWCPFEAIRDLKHSRYTVLNPRDDHHYNVSNSPIVNADGSVSKFTIFRDVTETLSLEKQLRQVQKLEAIGTLAGGIAHDFNNILFAIMGFAEISLASVNRQEQVYNDLQEIVKAGHRAKDLVRQILTFSRQTEQEMQPLRIRLIVKEALRLLKASLPATIKIRENISSKSKIIGDATQIHQVIMNLCTNSAHAMEENGGVLTIDLHDTLFDEEMASKFIKMPMGNYLHLRITDTGHGIRKEDLERIFEPFYTTKPDGKGTGLGLSLVHGIIKNHKGQITVESVPREGSSFDIYLPIIDSVEDYYSMEQQMEELPGGNEKIMIVDDEEPIIKITRRSLSGYGYSVDGVTQPEQAIEIFRQSPFDYDMVITDMTMPGMTGDVLAEKLLQIRPDLPIILITGFSNRINLENHPPDSIKKVLLKPIIKYDLLHAVRNIFDEKK